MGTMVMKDVLPVLSNVESFWIQTKRVMLIAIVTIPSISIDERPNISPREISSFLSIVKGRMKTRSLGMSAKRPSCGDVLLTENICRYI
jgi:hypothetical protein